MAKKTTGASKKATTNFDIGDYVVYPTHGVGKIIGEETQEVGGMTLKLFVISFEKDKMTLRVPVNRAHSAGLRMVSDASQMEKAFRTLQGRAKTSRGMWSRRAQEYETKINSGNLISIAEVVRDLHKNVDQSERSYSERMIYESAFNRIAGELAAAEKIGYEKATDKLIDVLKKQAA
jgi:CarD family transcriptional regulator